MKYLIFLLPILISIIGFGQKAPKITKQDVVTDKGAILKTDSTHANFPIYDGEPINSKQQSSTPIDLYSSNWKRLDNSADAAILRGDTLKIFIPLQFHYIKLGSKVYEIKQPDPYLEEIPRYLGGLYLQSLK